MQWGWYPGAGGTGAVPRVFIERGHAAPTPHCALLGWGLCAGGCRGRQGSGIAAGMLCIHHLSIARAWHPPAHCGRGQRDVARGTGSVSGSAAGQQERFLPPVCTGSGSAEAFPVRGELSWQQPEPPLSLRVAPGPSWAPDSTTDGDPLLLLTRDVCVAPSLSSPLSPKLSTPRAGGGQAAEPSRREVSCLPSSPAPVAWRCSGHGKGELRAGPGSRGCGPWPKPHGCGTGAHAGLWGWCVAAGTMAGGLCCPAPTLLQCPPIPLALSKRPLSPRRAQAAPHHGTPSLFSFTICLPVQSL